MVFNIHVTYNGHTKLFECKSRREFWSKVANFYELDRSELKLFEINQGSRKPITINDLSDLMKVEVTTGTPQEGTVNGQSRENPDEILTRAPDKDALMEKLKGNTVLTGLERKFLVQHLDIIYDSLSTSRKRKKHNEEDNDSDIPKQKVNKKIQVDCLIPKRSYHTQTDKYLSDNIEKALDKPSTTSKLIAESKRLAQEKKLDKKKAFEIMNETYNSRRNFILMENPVLSLIKEKYPLLFNRNEVLNELNRIFYNGKDEEFLSNVERSSKAILSIVEEENPLLKLITKITDDAPSSEQKKYAEEVGAILMISNILSEKRSYLNTEDEPCEKNNYPRIEAPCKVNKLFYDKNVFQVVAEGIQVCEALNFKEAILCLMACYFLFNISYPDNTSNTFIVFEKIFLDANDTDNNDIDEQTSQIIKLIKYKTEDKRKKQKTKG